MKPKGRYKNGSWYVTGGLVPIELCLAAHQSLGAAMGAVCRWYRGEPEPWVPYREETR